MSSVCLAARYCQAQLVLLLDYTVHVSFRTTAYCRCQLCHIELLLMYVSIIRLIKCPLTIDFDKNYVFEAKSLTEFLFIIQ